MNRPLDLVWVSRDLQVIKIDTNINPWKVKSCSEAYGVFEFWDENFPKALRVGDRIMPSKKYCDWKRFKASKSIYRYDGQALLETALVMPFLMLFVLGFLQISQMISLQQKLTHTVNYAAEIGALTNDDTKVFGAVDDFFDDSVDLTTSILSLSSHSGLEIESVNRRYGDTLKVQIITTFPWSLPLVPSEVLEIEATAAAPIICQEEHYPYTCND